MCVLAVWHNKGLLLFFNTTGKTIIKKNADILNVLFLLSLSAYHLETILASVYQAQKGLKIYKRIFSTV